MAWSLGTEHSMTNILRFAVLGSSLGFSALLVGACGGDDDSGPENPVDLCDRVATTACAKIYSCTTVAERRVIGLPDSEAECVVGLATQVHCESATADKVCAGTASYTVAQAKQCITEANAATCAMIIANQKNVTAYAPTCGQCTPF
jgi:hypothetical protein